MTRPTSPPIKSDLGLVNSATLMELLYYKAEPYLKPADLRKIAIVGANYAERVASNAADVAEGIGALISAECEGVGARRSGALQEGNGQAELLWHFAEVLRAVQGAAHVASRAASIFGDDGAA